MSKQSRRSKGAVEWYLPNKKRPFAYSTTATSDLINALGEEYNNNIKAMYNAINYDDEAKKILQVYIDYEESIKK